MSEVVSIGQRNRLVTRPFVEPFDYHRKRNLCNVLTDCKSRQLRTVHKREAYQFRILHVIEGQVQVHSFFIDRAIVSSNESSYFRNVPVKKKRIKKIIITQILNLIQFNNEFMYPWITVLS